MTSQEILEVLVRMRGGQQLNRDATVAAGGLGKIEKSAKGAEYASERASLRIGKLRTNIGFLGRSAFAVAGIAGIASLVEAGRLAVGAFKDQQVAAAQTTAVLRSTKSAAHLTAGEITGMAGSMAELAGMDKASVQAGLNTLLTFRNIRNEAGRGNDVFSQAAKLTQDLSVVRHMDIKTAALWVGKALNDPVKGFARLQRVGVTFTKSQQDQIKLYDALGMKQQAQKIILGELTKVVGGSAEAYGKTLPGELGKAKLALTEVGIIVGSAVAPYFATAAGAVAGFLTQMRDGTGAGGKFVGVLKDAGGVLKTILGPPLGFIVDHIRTLGVLLAVGAGAWAAYRTAMLLTEGVMLAIQAIQFAQVFLAAADAIGVAGAAMIAFDAASWANPIGLVVIAIAALVAGFILLGGHLSWIGTAFTRVWDGIKAGVGAVVGFVSAHWPLLLTILAGPFGFVAQYVIRHFDQIVGFVSAMPGRIASVAVGMFDGVKNAFRSAINWILTRWNNLSLRLAVPKKVLGIPVPGGGHGVTINTPDVPLLAAGGDVTRGGMAVVGERGPELVALPAGASVTPRRHAAKQIIQLVVDGRVLAEAVAHAAEDAAAFG